MAEPKYPWQQTIAEHNEIFELSKQYVHEICPEAGLDEDSRTLKVQNFEVSDRLNYITESTDSFLLHPDKFEDFDSEVETVWGDDRSPDSRLIAHKLFIGLGIASVAIQRMLLVYQPSDLKRDQYNQQLSEVFASSNDIEEKFCEIFSEDGFEDRAFMASGIFDERAQKINGLRMCFRMLFDSGLMLEDQESSVHYDELITAASEYIKKDYSSLPNAFKADLLMLCGKNPEAIDKQFFDELPDWVIAAATPLRPNAYKHLFSRSWQID